jgi:hypothetical protein
MNIFGQESERPVLALSSLPSKVNSLGRGEQRGRLYHADSDDMQLPMSSPAHMIQEFKGVSCHLGSRVSHQGLV